MIPSHEKIFQVYQRIRRPLIHSAIYISGTIISGLVSLITFPILARLISVEDMGKYDFFMFMLLSAVPFVSFGIETGLGAFAYEMDMHQIREILKKILPISIISGMIISIGVAAAKYFGAFQTFSYYLIFLWTVSLISLSACYIIRAIYIWKQYPIKATLLRNGEWIMASLLGIIFLLASNHHKLESYLLGFSISMVLIAIFSYLLWPKTEFKKTPSSLPSSSKLVYQIIKVSLPYGLSQAVFILSISAEKLLVLKILGPSQLGLYAMLTKISSIPRLIGTSLLIGIVPEILSQKKDVAKAHLITLSIILGIFISTSLVTIYLFRRQLVLIFGGPIYTSITNLLWLGAMNELLTLIPWIINVILLKRRISWPILFYAITSSCITMLVGLYLIKHYQLLGGLLSNTMGKTLGISLLFYIFARFYQSPNSNFSLSKS